MRNKCDMLSLLFHGAIDIIMICETKVNDSFPTEQFIIEGYSTIYRLDRNDRGGGIMLIVKDNLLTLRLDKYCFPDKFEILCIELNLRKKKWIIFCYYNPQKHLLKRNLCQIETAVSYYSKTYENSIILGHFNAEISDFNMDSFCTINNFKCVIKEPTSYNNPHKPTGIDLILRNCPNNFHE